MRNLTFKDFRPRAEITVHTTTGEVYKEDFTADCISCELSRSVSGEAGAFAITLVARTDKHGRTWQDKVRPMDYVEVRMENTGAKATSLVPGATVTFGGNLKLSIRMRGFVDSSEYSIAFGPSGGPERAIVISGRDYTKLFANIFDPILMDHERIFSFFRQYISGHELQLPPAMGYKHGKEFH